MDRRSKFIQQIILKQIAGGNGASFMKLAIPNDASLTPDLLPLHRCNPDLLHSATLQPQGLAFDWLHEQLAISVGVFNASQTKGKALVGMATLAPRGTSLMKAPMVVAPCMEVMSKNNTPQEYVQKQSHMENKFLKEPHFGEFALHRKRML